MEPVAFDELRARLGRLARRRRTFPGVKRAAVLVGLLPLDGRMELLLTRRPESLNTHGGQVAFPGGKLDPGEEVLDAALRETEEELGIPAARIEPLGMLHDVLVTSGYCMTPWVARVTPGPYTPSPDEVARVFQVPLSDLADPSVTRFYERPKGFMGKVYRIPYFEWEDELIWGATGKVVHDLLRLLDIAPREDGSSSD